MAVCWCVVEENTFPSQSPVVGIWMTQLLPSSGSTLCREMLVAREGTRRAERGEVQAASGAWSAAPPRSMTPGVAPASACPQWGFGCLLLRAIPSAPRRCARVLPNLGHCEHCADCDSAHPQGSCDPGCHLCTRAARGGGNAPSRAPFKRCQGLIDEKCPQQVRTCLRRRRRPGSGGCFSRSAAVVGSLPQLCPPGIPGSQRARVGVEAGGGTPPPFPLP